MLVAKLSISAQNTLVCRWVPTSDMFGLLTDTFRELLVDVFCVLSSPPPRSAHQVKTERGMIYQRYMPVKSWVYLYFVSRSFSFIDSRKWELRS